MSPEVVTAGVSALASFVGMLAVLGKLAAWRGEVTARLESVRDDVHQMRADVRALPCRSCGIGE